MSCFDDQIMNLGDDVTERFMNQYIGYRRLKNFSEIVGLKRKLNVFIDGPVDSIPRASARTSAISATGAPATFVCRWPPTR